MLEQRVYKNYKELCKAMSWKVTSSDSKNKQFKELTSICKWHKEGNKIVIDEIYSQPKEIIDNRYATIDKLPYLMKHFQSYKKLCIKKIKKAIKS